MPARVEQRLTLFADLPTGDLACSTAAYLRSEFGLPLSYPEGAAEEWPAVTAYELGTAAGRMHGELAAALRTVDPSLVASSIAKRTIDPKLLTTIASRERFRRACGWLQALTTELDAALVEARYDSRGIEEDLAHWQSESQSYASWAAKRLAGPDSKIAAGRVTRLAGREQARRPGPFTDVPASHPCYAAVGYLADQGIFSGYPDGAFRGRRALTRYEFAVALQRMLQEVQNAARQAELDRALRVPGQTAAARPPAAGPHDGADPRAKLGAIFRNSTRLRVVVAWLGALTNEFERELTILGMDVPACRKSLDTLRERNA